MKNLVRISMLFAMLLTIAHVTFAHDWNYCDAYAFCDTEPEGVHCQAGSPSSPCNACDCRAYLDTEEEEIVCEVEGYGGECWKYPQGGRSEDPCTDNGGGHK